MHSGVLRSRSGSESAALAEASEVFRTRKYPGTTSMPDAPRALDRPAGMCQERQLQEETGISCAQRQTHSSPPDFLPKSLTPSFAQAAFQRAPTKSPPPGPRFLDGQPQSGHLGS